MMRVIVFAMIVSMLIMEATSFRIPLGEAAKSEQIAENLNEWSPGLDKNGLLMRRAQLPRCPDAPGCFVALMGRRSIKKIADSNTAKSLQDPQNYNFNPQYIK